MSRWRIMTSYFIIEDHYQSLFLYTVITIASIIIAYQFVFFGTISGRHWVEYLPGCTRANSSEGEYKGLPKRSACHEGFCIFLHPNDPMESCGLHEIISFKSRISYFGIVSVLLKKILETLLRQALSILSFYLCSLWTPNYPFQGIIENENMSFQLPSFGTLTNHLRAIRIKICTSPEP